MTQDTNLNDLNLLQNKKLKRISLEDDILLLASEDEVFEIWDKARLCCQARYMRTDDDLSYFIDSTFLGIEIKDAPPLQEDDRYVSHEVQFLEIKTNIGSITFSSHRENNGYYGGFDLIARKVEKNI